MEEKRNKFKVLVINEATGMRMEMPVSKGMADRVLKEIVNYETTGKNNNSNDYTPSHQETEGDVQETARRHFPEELIEEEFPEPTGRQEPIERGLLPKDRVKAVRIGGWRPKGEAKYVPINFIRVAKAVMNEFSKVRTRSIRVDSLLKAVVKRYGTKAISGNYYTVINNLANEMGYTIVRKGKHNRLYFNGVPKTGIKLLPKSVKKIEKGGRGKFISEKLLELSDEGKRKIRVDKFIKLAGFNYSTGQLRESIYKEASELGFKITRGGRGGGRGRGKAVSIILSKKTEKVWKRIKKKQKSKIYIEIKKKLLELSNQGIKKVRQKKIAFDVSKPNYPSAHIYKKIAQAVSDLDFEMIKDRGRQGLPKTIILKKGFEPSSVPKSEKKQTIKDKIRDKLLELSEKGRKEIRMADLLNSIKVNRSGTTYLLTNKIISNMGFQTIKDKSKGGRGKIIILKKGFKPSPSVEKYSSRGIKIRDKLLELSGTGKREIFGGELIKSLGIERSGYTYDLLDDIAKDMGFEVIKTGKARSCRKKIILKKEEPKGSRAFMSIYAKTLNEWEKIPTPFNLRQATFKLFGVMGGYNYNLTSMNVGQALNKLVRQGKLVRKKVLGTIQARGKKEWRKEMWMYDLPKEGEELQEVAPEPQEDIDLPVISEDTLISVFDNHIEISPKTFCGFYTKTGQPITERQGKFLFYFIRDNIGFIQGITGKKIVVGGYGQWQTIKIR